MNARRKKGPKPRYFLVYIHQLEHQHHIKLPSLVTWGSSFRHLLYERLPPGSRRGHPTASNCAIRSTLHHKLPQVTLLLLHLRLLLLLLLLLLGIHQGTVSVHLFAPLRLVTHHCFSQRSLHSSSLAYDPATDVVRGEYRGGEQRSGDGGESSWQELGGDWRP